MGKIFFLLLLCVSSLGFCKNRIINPITDINWGCLFPMHVSGAKVGKESTLSSYSKTLCFCKGTPPKAGIPLAFWEPARLIEVVKEPYKLLALGGMKIASSHLKGSGGVFPASYGGQTSFHHVHYYTFPILAWLELLSDFSCITESEFDVGYMSEFDPSWTDEKWASILHPEILLFANPIAEATCVTDCAAATAYRPNNALFWCAGCYGSIFPLTGFVSYHLGLVQTSSLLVHRLIAKLHSVGLLRNYKGENFCERAFTPRLDKLQYKTQLIYPVSQTKGSCNRLGASTLLWEIGKEYPINGEELVYLIWRKKHCCLDAIKPTAKKMLGSVK